MNSFTEKNEYVPEMQQNIELLKEISFFSTLPVKVLKLIAFVAVRESFSPGDLLYEEGDDPNRAYLVLNGSLVLTTQRAEEEETVIQRFTEGDFFGSLSLFGRMPALFNLKTETKTSLLTLDREKFSKILVQFPEIQPLSMKTILKEIHRWERTNISEAAPCCITRMGVTAL